MQIQCRVFVDTVTNQQYYPETYFTMQLYITMKQIYRHNYVTGFDRTQLHCTKFRLEIMEI